MTDILITLSGKSHDGQTWPTARIKINGLILWQGEVLDNLYVPFDISLDESNALEIEHYGKSFGENGVWHSSQSGDRNITVKQICMGGVDLHDLLHLGKLYNQFNQFQLDDFAASNQDVPHVKQFVHTEDIFMGYNGRYVLEFPKDVYDWIIVQKSPFMRPYDPKKASSLNSVNWRLDWINSHEVVKLMEDVQSLLDDYRCKH